MFTGMFRSRIGIAMIASVLGGATVGVGVVVTSPGVALAARPSAAGQLGCYASGFIRVSPRLSNTAKLRRFVVRATLDCKSIEGYPGTGGITSGSLFAKGTGAPPTTCATLFTLPPPESFTAPLSIGTLVGKVRWSAEFKGNPGPKYLLTSFILSLGEVNSYGTYTLSGSTSEPPGSFAGGSATLVMQPDSTAAVLAAECTARAGLKRIAFGAIPVSSRFFVQS